MMLHVLKRFGSVVVALAFSINACRAGSLNLINVDIDPKQPPTVFTGAAVIGEAGDFWNESPTFRLNPISLRYADGSPSPVSLQLPIYSYPGGYYGAPGFSGSSSPMAQGPYGALMGDGIGSFFTALPTVFTLSGLIPGANYELIAYSYLSIAGSTTFYVAGSTATVTYPSGLAQLVEGQSYAHFHSVTASQSGELPISLGGINTINGFQIRQVAAVPDFSVGWLGVFPLLAMGIARATGVNLTTRLHR